MLHYIRALPTIITLLAIEFLSEYQLYRRLKGNVWYHVCEFETGEEFWTQEQYPPELAFIFEQEDWS